MSNLGWYQTLTTAAKAVGGPKRLVVLLVGGGTILGVGGTLGTQKVVKTIKAKIKAPKVTYSENGRIFNVSCEFSDKNGLQFKPGDQYKIISRDNDAIMIEKLGDKNNPYYVSSATLKEISNFVIVG